MRDDGGKGEGGGCGVGTGGVFFTPFHSVKGIFPTRPLRGYVFPV